MSKADASPISVTIAALLAFGACGTAHAETEEAIARARSAFAERMAKDHGFDRDALTSVLESAVIDQKIIDAISRPAERVVPWHEYRNIFVTDKRIAAGVQFWQENADAVQRITADYGIAPEMVVGIIGVETFFGQIVGRYRVIDALSTLAFAYPPRAKFFTSELESFLLLAREEGVDAREPLGSYAGAMGRGQFIPSSFRAYAVDANGDGRRDIWTDWEDVIGSVANYFEKHGWREGQPVAVRATRSAAFSGAEPSNKLDLSSTVGALADAGYEFSTTLPASAPAAVFSFEAEGGGSEYWVGLRNFEVITRYNRSAKYALAAHQLAQAIRDRYLAASGGRAE
jgi:membrane-bound lytic murein transglycosylase B